MHRTIQLHKLAKHMHAGTIWAVTNDWLLKTISILIVQVAAQ